VAAGRRRRAEALSATGLPYDEAGSGPAVILLHAGVADRGMWSEHLEPFASAGYRVVAVDLPGFGEAGSEVEGPVAPWTDVLGTMDALGIDRAAVVGNSFGGAVRVAAVAPSRVWALVLISAPPPGLTPSPQLAAAWEAEESALERGEIDAAVDAVLSAWTLPDSPAGLRERVAGMQRRAFELQASGAFDDQAPDPLEEDQEVLSSLQVPVLVAAGDRDMPDFRHGAELLAAALPRARRAVIEGAGHLAPLDTPDAFRQLVLGFLWEAAPARG
jgi:pimeloyl-ACP methyl ester carboxylesterase